MKFTIRKYEKYGWQIWNTDEGAFSGDIIGESDKFFIVALVKFLWNLLLDKEDY